jgi:hypothetical protein
MHQCVQGGQEKDSCERFMCCKKEHESREGISPLRRKITWSSLICRVAKLCNLKFLSIDCLLSPFSLCFVLRTIPTFFGGHSPPASLCYAMHATFCSIREFSLQGDESKNDRGFSVRAPFTRVGASNGDGMSVVAPFTSVFTGR